MTEQKIPDRGVWMSPGGVHLVIETDDGELDGLEHNADAGWLLVGMYDQVPDEFVQLVPAPAPRVWFPGDTVPAGVRGVDSRRWIYGDLANDWTVPLSVRGGAIVELVEPYPDEWQAAVDRARAEREESL